MGTGSSKGGSGHDEGSLVLKSNWESGVVKEELLSDFTFKMTEEVMDIVFVESVTWMGSVKRKSLGIQVLVPWGERKIESTDLILVAPD